MNYESEGRRPKVARHEAICEARSNLRGEAVAICEECHCSALPWQPEAICEECHCSALPWQSARNVIALRCRGNLKQSEL